MTENKTTEEIKKEAEAYQSEEIVTASFPSKPKSEALGIKAFKEEFSAEETRQNPENSAVPEVPKEEVADDHSPNLHEKV